MKIYDMLINRALNGGNGSGSSEAPFKKALVSFTNYNVGGSAEKLEVMCATYNEETGKLQTMPHQIFGGSPQSFVIPVPSGEGANGYELYFGYNITGCDETAPINVMGDIDLDLANRKLTIRGNGDVSMTAIEIN
jgi:hypothetical protein